MDVDYKQLATVVFFGGGIVWLIKWIGRTLVEVGGGKPKPRDTSDARLERLLNDTGVASYLAAQGGSSRPEPSRMVQHEREVRAQEDALRAAAAAPIAAGATQSLPHVGRMTGVAVRLHCPMCGEPLSEVPVPLPFAVECPGCHRRLNARGDGPQRMSIGVIEPRRPTES